MIKDLKEGMQESSIFLVRSINTKTTSKGNPYLDVEFGDSSGTVNGKVWDVGTIFTMPVVGDVVDSCYEVTSYNGRPQLNVRQLTIKQLDSVDCSKLFPHTNKDTDEMWGALMQLKDSVKDKDYSTLLNLIYGDAEFVEKFKKSSAAVKAHHAFVGGLLEHTLGVTKVAVKIGSVVPEACMDLIVTAAMLHDVGKVYEYSLFPSNQRTRLGMLVGHVSYGASLIMSTGEGKVDQKKLDQVVHCILSHHGKLEYGSPTMPAIIEAEILHFADNIDSKIEMFREAFNDPNFSEENGVFNRYLETTIFKTV